jgi:glycosyltransferase involved in cell wall biosynthesis
MIVTNSLTGGGAERSMNMLANELMRQGLVVGLVPVNKGAPDQIQPQCEVMALNRIWPGGIIDTFIAYLKFNRVVSKWKPDVLIINCDLPELLAAISRLRKTLIIVEHTSFPWNSRKKLGLIVRKILTLRGAWWVAVSNHLSAWPKRKDFTAVIPNPVDKSAKEMHLHRMMILKRVVFIGRLSIEKRPEWLLEVARHVKYPVEIIGDGILRSQLEKSSKDEGLDIHFHGQVLEPWSLVHDGDLLVIPSLYEGDGLVLVEAMAHRCAVLVADIPDLRRFSLPDESYCLNPQELIRRIRRFQNDLSPLLVPQSISNAELSARSIERVGESWVNLLKKSQN